MTYSFAIPLKITNEFSLNRVGNWLDKYQRNKKISQITYVAMRDAGLPRTPIDYPITVGIKYKSGLDIDNHGMIAKSIIDGMRAYGLLADDNKAHIVALYQSFNDGDGVTVTLKEDV